MNYESAKEFLLQQQENKAVKLDSRVAAMKVLAHGHHLSGIPAQVYGYGLGNHSAPDTAVLTAYGFNAKKDLLAQLLALNQEVAAKIEKGEAVISPGVPQNYPDAKKLVTKDCIKPIVNP